MPTAHERIDARPDTWKDSSVALDHYLPATYLAGFSADETEARRDRPLWALDRATQRLFESRCSKLGAINDLYAAKVNLSDLEVDAFWAKYEDRLAIAIDALTENRSSWIDGRLWARVLVPFVAGTL